MNTNSVKNNLSMHHMMPRIQKIFLRYIQTAYFQSLPLSSFTNSKISTHASVTFKVDDDDKGAIRDFDNSRRIHSIF